MGEERVFYQVPVMSVTVRCHRYKDVLQPGDEYYMTDDDSWIFCRRCASTRDKPTGPRARVYPEHERTPLHKRVTLKESI
jgi:hypothetical protein